MHEELIGQEASLSLPSTIDAAEVLLGFIEELMEVSGDETHDPDRVAADLANAISAIRAADEVDASCNVVARLEIHEHGVEIRLTCENQDAVSIELDEQVVEARKA